MRAQIRDTQIFFDVEGASLAADSAGIRERPTAFLIHGGPGIDHMGLKARYGKLAEKMRRYFEVMGPLYARRDDPALSKSGLERTILSPEALNRAHGPGGRLRPFDLRPELAAIHAPTLICAGRHDWVCAPALSEEIHRLIPNSDLRIFEESSHSIGGDEPQKLFDVIAGFLIYNTRAKPA